MSHNQRTLLVTTFILILPIFGHSQDELKFKGLDERPKQVSKEEQVKANEFVHQGYIQSQVDGVCNNKANKDACAGDEATVFGDADAMVPAVSKMYSVFAASGPLGSMNFGNATGTTGAGTQAGTNATQGAQQEDPNPSKYCDLLPVATEGAALAGQQMEQKQIDEGKAAPGTEQRENLFKAARSHEARSNTTIIQTTGFSSTATCYLATGLQGHSDPKVLLKTAAAVGLAGFYGMKTMAHLDYADKTKSIAKRIPGKGACNPYTEPNCFCTEPTSQGMPEFNQTCISQPFRARAKPGVIATSCVDANQKPDVNCTCLKTQSCFDAQFVQFAGGIRGGVAKLDDTLSGVSAISRGNINRGQVESANLARLAKAKDFLNQSQLPSSLEAGELSANQLKEARALEKLGVPGRYARVFAKFPSRPDLYSKIGGAIPANYLGNSQYKSDYNAPKSNVVYFDSPSSSSNSFRGSSRSNFELPKSGPAPAANAETLNFAAEAATNKADIHQGDDTSIFKIISHRYIQSVRNLDIDLNQVQ